MSPPFPEKGAPRVGPDAPLVTPDTPFVTPDAARAYSAWLVANAAGHGFDAYYSEETLRFEVRDDDVLAAPADVTASSAPCGTRLESARAGAVLTVCGISPDAARAALAAMDGERTVIAARNAAALPAESWGLLLRGAFGSLVFAPFALARLEARVSFAEIVRFPGSPYEVVRSYWENMAEVRARLETLDAALADAGAFVELLRELNALALVGKNRRSFYRPASPVAAKGGLEPGALWHAESVTEEAASGVRFVSGPRVGATPIGGERYHALLSRSFDDAPPGRPSFGEGLSWGHVVTARSDADLHAAPWFCPPRPITPGHFEAIRNALLSARDAQKSGRAEDVVRHLAHAHFGFVRLHPFMSGNQSVAMSLVNAVLRRALGAGIPHLVLDHLALGLPLAAYEQAFARAVVEWLVVDPSPVRRALELAARKRRVWSFLEELRSAPAGQIEELLATRSGDAALALLVAPE